jgi:hypothetical protein
VNSNGSLVKVLDAEETSRITIVGKYWEGEEMRRIETWQ